LSVSVNGLDFGHFQGCKTVYPGSIPGVASINKYKDLAAIGGKEGSGRKTSMVRHW
jgi:hypothetical protein